LLGSFCLSSRLLNGGEHMTTEHTVVRSGKSKRKPFNSNAADYLLIIATFAFSYITSTNCTCTDARCWWSRLKLRTSAPGLSHSEELRADSHSVTARSRAWSGNNVRRVGRNSPPRLDRRLEFGHEPTRDTAHISSSRFGGFWNAPPRREVSAPPVFATAQRIWIDS
jgi:hypothetical protein